MACMDDADTIFQGLRDPKTLTRERALEALRQGIAAGQLAHEALEPQVLADLAADGWEARQSAALAAVEMLKAWDRPAFRAALLQAVPRLLVDPEYRVRKAVAPVLRECCIRDGLSVYDELSGVVLGDIRANFLRPAEDLPDDPGQPPPPPTFLPDTEGWRSLETSMGALEAMMQGCGVNLRLDGEILDLLAECTRHTNRFVREHAFLALRNAFEVCSQEAFLDSLGRLSVGLLAAGLRDAWSQVRYAASVAARVFMQKAGDDKARYYPHLLGIMCLNRHYAAEGVRRYSQDTWREVCGPQGGSRLLVAHFDSVIDCYLEAADDPDHEVREAGCKCILELAARVAGTPGSPTPFRDHFTHTRVQRLLRTLVVAFQDESWLVRDVAGTALGYCAAAFPMDSEHVRHQLVDLWFEEMADNIPSMRQNGAAALSMAVTEWPDLWEDVVHKMARTLPDVLLQPEKSELSTDPTQSGPYAVPRPKPVSLEEKPELPSVSQSAYGRNPFGAKTAKRRDRAGGDGCMSCAERRPVQLWEASEGMVHLFTELALLNMKDKGPCKSKRADELAALLPLLARSFACSHYRHHHVLKQRVCERLPGLSEALCHQRLLPHLPELLPIVVDCASQGGYYALREAARSALTAWRTRLPREELEAACRAAGCELGVLSGG